MNWKSLALSISIALLVSFALPAYILPILFRTLGIDIVRGFAGIEISLYISSTSGFPMLILRTPDTYLALGLGLSGVMAGVYIYYRSVYLKNVQLRKQLLEFIPLVSSYVRTGTPITHALELALSVVKPPLATYIEKFVSLVKLGEDPSEAYRKVFKGIPREVRAIMSSIVIAMVSGGKIEEVLEAAERYVEQLVRMDELRSHRLAEYKIVLLLSVLAFSFAGVVVIKLIESVTGMATTFPGAYQGIDIDFVESSYFIASLFLATISSIVMSRMVTGSLVLAPKYISLLSAITTLMYALHELVRI